MTTLMAANAQWQSRPADERFSSLADLHARCAHQRSISAESKNVALRDLRVEAGVDQPLLVGSTGARAQFTHHSFGQLCRTAGAPAAYLRELPAELVARNLNYSLQHSDRLIGEEGDKTAKLLFSKNGALTLRATTGNGYSRIWNADISSRLIRLTEQHPEWQPAPAAFDGSRGLYAGDTNMFVFLVDNDRRIFQKDAKGGLGRGFFASNSEVGDASFRLTTFLYNYVCGNHMVWGAQGVKELRIPHIGDANERAFREMTVELKAYADSSAKDDEAKVSAAQRFQIAGTKDEVLDRVFGLRIMPRNQIEAGYEKAELREDWYGSPRSAWGLAGGLTEIARDLPNADARVQMERAAGKVLQMAF